MIKGTRASAADVARYASTDVRAAANKQSAKPNAEIMKGTRQTGTAGVGGGGTGGYKETARPDAEVVKGGVRQGGAGKSSKGK